MSLEITTNETTSTVSVIPASKVSVWAKDGYGNLLPVQSIVDKLDPGVYIPKASLSGISLKRVSLSTKTAAVSLSNDLTQAIIAEIDTYVGNKEAFVMHSIPLQKNVLILGNKNEGKSTLLYSLIKQITNTKGVVLLPSDPLITKQALQYIKNIDPELNPILCIDDLDKYIEKNGLEQVSSLLADKNIIIATSSVPLKELLNIKKIAPLTLTDKENYLKFRFPYVDIKDVFSSILTEIGTSIKTVSELETIGFLLLAHNVKPSEIVNKYRPITEDKTPVPLVVEKPKRKKILKQLFLDSNGALKTIVEEEVDDVLVVSEDSSDGNS